MYKKNYKGWLKHIDFILIDILSMYISFGLSLWIRLKVFFAEYDSGIYREMAFQLLLINLVVALVFQSFNGVLKRGKLKEALETVKHVVLVTGILMLFLFLVKKDDGIEYYSRAVIFIMMGLYVVTSYISRMIYKVTRRRNIINNRAFMVVTSVKKAADILEKLKRGVNNGIKVTSLVFFDEDRTGMEFEGIPVVAGRDDMVEYVCREWIDEVFINLKTDEHPELQDVIKKLIVMGVTVHHNIEDLTDVLGQEYFIENISGMATITTSLRFISPFKMFCKKTMDIAGGLIGSVFTLLLTVIIGPIIYIKSPGPIFFKQERIGQNGKRFRMIKFRSMRMDAEERKKELMEENRVKDGMMFKLDWDPRIIGNRELPDGTRKTGIGEFIRKTSIDEFPQFFNVLKGDMSLVGTRPPTKDEWEKYQLHHRARLAVKPGITGMWQVNGRSEITDFEQVVKLDTEYITNWSLWLDVKILAKTVASVFKGRGAM